MPKHSDINARYEIESAIRGFTEQTYFVLMNHTKVADLSYMVDLTSETGIQFIKPLPLKGGQ